MNKYKELRTLGKGSFGRAVLVEEISTRKPYVIKIIQTSSMKPKEREEALQEAEILERLEHPNIIAYKESFQDQRFLYIVMEYANKGDLYELIKREQGHALPEDVIWDYFVQLCLAVKHIHDRRILHRDLKTQNVFLTEENGKIMCKIGDFGVSKILSSTLECAKTAIGTPYYLSPELCNNQGYNNKSDVWAMGCILYEMCTLEHTFEAANMKMLIVKILEGKYKPIPQNYSDSLKRLITLLLQKDPKKRPSVNSLLRLPELQQRIDAQLSGTQAAMEFAHTAFHGKGDVLRGFEQEREIKAVMSPSAPIFNEPAKADNVFAARPQIEGGGERVGIEHVGNVEVVAVPSNAFAKPPAKPIAQSAPETAAGYVPSDETLLSKFNELDQMLYKSPVAAPAAPAVQPALQYPSYPANVKRAEAAPAAQAVELSQPRESEQEVTSNKSSPTNYAPPAEYEQKINEQKQNLNQHQREVAAKLAPMSDRDRARYAREKELADKHAKAQEMRKQNKENIARGEERVEDKQNRINEQYEQNLRVKREQMYRDEDELNARKAQMLKNKADERIEARNEMLEEQRKNQEIAERERERRDREREKLREMMAEKRRQSANQRPEDAEVEIFEEEREVAMSGHEYPVSYEKQPESAPKAIEASEEPQDPSEQSQSFGDLPDAAFEQPFSDHENWQNLLNSQNEADSLCYRMESLKEYLEKQLGFDRFLAVYEKMQDATDKDNDFDEEQVETLLGTGNLGWMNLIVELILVEKRFNECE